VEHLDALFGPLHGTLDAVGDEGVHAFLRDVIGFAVGDDEQGKPGSTCGPFEARLTT
jgi:hypothetical protein